MSLAALKANRAKVATMALILVIVTTVALFACNLVDENLRKVSADLADQVNQLGQTLGPGEHGIITLSAENSDVDRLIYVGRYCPRDLLEQRLPKAPPEFIEHLSEVAKDKRSAPAFVWTKGTRIVQLDKAHITTGMNCSVHSWSLDQRRLNVQVRKESESLNSFLSVEFVDD